MAGDSIAHAESAVPHGCECCGPLRFYFAAVEERAFQLARLQHAQFRQARSSSPASSMVDATRGMRLLCPIKVLRAGRVASTVC